MAELRVVVTGVGVVSSIGFGAAAFLEGLRLGQSGASTVRAFSTQKFPSHIGCEVRDFDASLWVQKLRAETLGRSSQMAVAAARQAVADSSIGFDTLRDLRCDVVMGTTDGEAAVFDAFASAWLQHDSAASHGLPLLQTAEVISDTVQEELSLQGESAVVATACSAGNYAIGYGVDKLRDGAADAVLCGGSDAQCLKNFGGFFRIGALAPEKCQPFDRERKGILPGEGAAVLLLEPLERALARRAPIYAEVLGYGASCDGHHIMSPHEAGIVACARDALQRCGLQPDDVDYISAHGTATAANDVIETAAMRSVFGAQLPPMSSMKSMLGHTMGAASALAAVGCVLALKHSFMPPTINFTQPDPACAIDCVPNRARSAPLDVVQNNAFAFGGNNAIVLFKRYSSGRGAVSLL